ncbi:MFS transporter [Amycolatopsis sp. cmx-4-83]|uniref:MFS transporter n=1 Tax=Amycolatopsis sp. cmx-4-83 TaxID=2790940 RepID=UPI00397E5FF6
MSSEVPVQPHRPVPPPPRGTAAVPALVALATAVGSTGLAAGGTAGPLLATAMTGSAAAAGLPVAMNLAGQAGAAILISRLASQGRRGPGLAAGFAVGAAGAALVVPAGASGSFPLVLLGSVLLGAANAAVFLARYAAAAVVPPDRRGRALGRVLSATAAGAVVSPVLLGPGAVLAAHAGLVRESGAYLVAIVAFGAAALAFAALSRAGLSGGRPEGAETGGVLRALRSSRAWPAISALALTNFAMVGVMTVAPVHLSAGGDGLTAVGLVVALHVVCMFGPSAVTGALADRFDPVYLIAAGGVFLFGAGVLGAMAGEHDPVAMTLHLVLVGLGWNGGVVGGSALLGATASPGLRTHLEGIGEAAMGLAAVVAAPLAGVVSAIGGYRGLAAGLGVFAAAGLALTCTRARRRPS